MYQKLGKYELLEKLASTRKGIIYRAQDPAIGRVVAVKTIGESTSILDPKALDRLQQEARAAGNLRHPNIVTVFDADINSTPPYIVMDYIDGVTLQSLLETEGRLQPNRAVYILRQICNAVDFAHSQGILHRDIKPGNIMLDRQDRAFILDFGLALLDSSAVMDGNTIVGTPAYMSPEQIHNRQLDSASDLFSLAVVTYQMFCGRLPFAGSDYQAIMQSITQDPPHSIERRLGLPVQFEVQLQRALNKDPRRRFGSASEMLKYIESCFDPERLQHANPNDTAGTAQTNRAKESPAAEGGKVYIHDNINTKKGARDGIRPVEVAALSLLVIGCLLLVLALVKTESKPTRPIDINKHELLKDMAREEKADFSKSVEGLTDTELMAGVVFSDRVGDKLKDIIIESGKRQLPWLIDGVLPLLQHSDKDVRLAVVEVLSSDSHPDAVKGLIPALQDEDPMVALAVANALAKNGTLAALPELRHHLNKIDPLEKPELHAALKNTIEKIQGYPSK